MRRLSLPFAILFAAALSVSAANADSLAPRDGWMVIETPHKFPELVERLNEAVKANDMLLVTRASASAGAKNAGITIPGNMIVGVYRNDFARRMLEASVAAGIEAPVRYYITENSDGTATLSYKAPTTVFSPYYDDAGEDLQAVASELDALFDKIAREATAE